MTPIQRLMTKEVANQNMRPDRDITHKVYMCVIQDLKWAKELAEVSEMHVLDYLTLQIEAYEQAMIQQFPEFYE